MILAIPLTGKTLTHRLGCCDSYAFVKVNPEDRTVLGTETRVAPPHAPDHLPDWIAKMGADIVIAPEIPDGTRLLFEYHGLDVVVGFDQASAESLVQAYLSGAFENASTH